VIPGGTTSIVTETLELGTCMGKEGVSYLVNAIKEQPVRFFYTMAPFCGLTAAQEAQAPPNSELLDLLEDPNCLGIGEIYWGNLFLGNEQSNRIQELAAMTLGLGKRVEGHSAGAKEQKLQAYTCFGVSSCHEPVTEEQVLERLRLGYWVMVREGSIRKELEGIKGVFQQNIDFRRMTLSTDGVDPAEFLQSGYLDASLRAALQLGVSPALAYQMVTLNVAEHFRLDHLIGSIAPGKMADLVLVPSPEEYAPQWVMCDGRVIFQDGRRCVEPRKDSFPDHLLQTVKVADFEFPTPPQSGKVRVIDLITRLVTQERVIDLGNPDETDDINMALALDRIGNGKGFLGGLKGYGLQKGACGSTMCWDSGDLVVVGCDEGSMKTVIERLRALGGGAVYAIGEEVVSEFATPLCGVASLKTMEVVAKEVEHLESALKKQGVPWEKPLLTIDTLTTAAIPHFRITHDGYVRLKDREVLGVVP
jgi:adenine deaminase